VIARHELATRFGKRMIALRDILIIARRARAAVCAAGCHYG
jgi:hypothetical protein